MDVNAIFDRKRLEIVADLVPKGNPVFAKSLAPTIRGVQPPAPVGEIEDVVARKPLLARGRRGR